MTKIEYRTHWQHFAGGRILMDGVEVAKVEQRKSNRRRTGYDYQYFAVGDGFEIGPCGDEYRTVYAYMEHIGMLTFTEFGLDDGLSE